MAMNLGQNTVAWHTKTHRPVVAFHQSSLFEFPPKKDISPIPIDKKTLIQNSSPQKYSGQHLGRTIQNNKSPTAYEQRQSSEEVALDIHRLFNKISGGSNVESLFRVHVEGPLKAVFR